jgi:hypothetical protein
VLLGGGVAPTARGAATAVVVGRGAAAAAAVDGLTRVAGGGR